MRLTLNITLCADCTFLGNFQNRNLGPNAWDQINPIYYLPAEAAQDDFVNTDNEVNMSFDQPCELQPRCYSCSSYSDTGAYDAGIYSSTYSDFDQEFTSHAAPSIPVFGDFITCFGS